ncbi:MAG: bifunctional UDP-N-acetylglucosamine diphosphorylase/glucosamine-1-phosphate N-acetyltransferase GlmU [Holosporales bacterium]|jgi:bifunctional UDP-N-acetylglucosamine pyrophosphorylase/glucosamine-1-phosphate N-acetyltransferase|nr:bifunctional UDP-N-acetylglucosamine diphosphorylase/glucosamine-1-phosphate N-acetyltransferase GlmU [Holosporales bacterium]
MNKLPFDYVILAAGIGSRMHSSVPKFFQNVADKPVIRYIVDAFSALNPNGGVTVTSDILKDHGLFSGTKTVVQASPKGTGDAVSCAIPFLDSDYTIVICADTPLIRKEQIERLLINSSDIAFIVTKLPETLDYMPYGRVILEDGKFKKIVEFKEATEEEKRIDLINTGIYKFKTSVLKQHISDVKKNEVTGEYHLPDILQICQDINVILDEDYWSYHGINTMEDLAVVEQEMQGNLRRQFMAQGVKMLDPKTVYLSHDTQIDRDTIIEQNVVLKGIVRIHSGVTIKAFSYLEDCEIMSNTEVGPFARIRGNTVIGRNAQIGNFVEIKGSTINDESKAKHLTYIGDTTLGTGVNIGAGTVICNYDGVKKHKTTIGDKAFVGSNATLIAPVEIGAESFIAAGSVIVKHVPREALAISRSDQKNIDNGAKKILSKWDD